MIPNLWMRIYVMIPKLSSDSVAFIYSSSASVSLSLSLFSGTSTLSDQNCCTKSSQEEEVISPPDENLLIYCKPVRLYNILRIRSLFNPSFLPRCFLLFILFSGEVVTDGEKSKTGKKGAKAPWAKPLSQYSQGLAVCSSCNIFSKGLVFQFMRNEFSCLHVRFFYTTLISDFLEISKQMMLNHQKLTQPRITSKITEEQLKASSPGKSQTEDQIQTQEPAVQSQPEVTSRETMAASPPRQD
uniref:Uncharacterized protein n=1 Tax=Brassica oleracea var. oleracea TaxID=109376 RepID=A0A0D3CG01_BRAOL